jgi:hypothetical protein
MRTLVIMLVLGVAVHVTSAFAHHQFTRHAFIRVGQNGYWVTSVYGCIWKTLRRVFRTVASETESARVIPPRAPWWNRAFGGTPLRALSSRLQSPVT